MFVSNPNGAHTQNDLATINNKNQQHYFSNPSGAQSKSTKRYLQVLWQVKFEMTMDLYIDEKDKELGQARLSQVGEGGSAGGRGGGGGGSALSSLTHPLASPLHAARALAPLAELRSP